MRVFQVPGRRAQRLEQHRACQRRQPERPGQRPVLLQPPGQPPPDPGRRVIGAGDLPVGAGEPLQLVPRHRPGDLRQALLVLRGGDPGQRPHLGVRQPGRGELAADDRQVPQRPGHPDVLPGGTGGHLALPRQPARAAAHVPAGPAPAGIEISQQHQEPARRRGQVPGQLADLRLQPLQRHRGRDRSRGRSRAGGPGSGTSGPGSGTSGPGSGTCPGPAAAAWLSSRPEPGTKPGLEMRAVVPGLEMRAVVPGSEMRAVVPGSAPGRFVSNINLMLASESDIFRVPSTGPAFPRKRRRMAYWCAVSGGVACSRSLLYV